MNNFYFRILSNFLGSLHYEGMFLIFDVSKDFKDGHLSCYLNNSGDDRPKFKVSDKPLDGYRHFGRLVASMKNYEV